jgi:hypothetical protein
MDTQATEPRQLLRRQGRQFMVRIKGLWNTFKTIAILFSFIVNFVVILVLLFVVLLIFQIKNGIAQPLINGLYSSFAGLDQAKIVTTINVDDTINVKDIIPVRLDIPLQQETNVVLTREVPLRVPASFTLRDGTTLNGTVSIALPAGLSLPVALDLHVPVDSTLPIDIKVPVHLKVPVNIALSETQLHDPFANLQLLFDPFVRLLGNLPSEWDQVFPFIANIMSGKAPNLMASNKYIDNPWPGFRTGLGTPDPNSANSGQTGGPGNNGVPNNGTGGATDPNNPNNGGTTDNSGSGNTGNTGGTGGAFTPIGTPTHVQDLGIITPTPK